VDEGGHAKVADFGLARRERNEAIDDSTATLEGTVPYLAMELVTSDTPVATVASDIHALACVGLRVSD
jgi:hypothetical protein